MTRFAAPALLASLAVAWMLAFATPAAAGALAVELNKLEDRDGGCRLYVVIDSKMPAALESFRLDLVLFGPDGVIARRLAVEAGPLRAAKTTVKLFDVPSLACKDIAQVLVNDVLACRDAQGGQPDCVAELAVSSRATAKISK
jgi:hypothetical protein